MVIAAPVIKSAIPLEYPSSDGEPIAETYDHVYAIAILLEMLRQYLTGRQATVLGNQFLYYAQGFPRMRIDNGEKLPFPSELAEKVNQERQAKQELEVLLQRYRDRYGDLE